MDKRYGRIAHFPGVIGMILAISLLSGCVVVPRGGYYIHPCWHCGWRR